ANMRSVQIKRSTHGQFAGADASCLASCRDTSDALLARSLICPSRIHLPASLPSARVVVSGPFALHVTPQAESALPLVGAAFPTVHPQPHASEDPPYYEGSAHCQAAPRPTGRPLCLAHTSPRSVSHHRRGPTIALHAIPCVADAF